MDTTCSKKEAKTLRDLAKRVAAVAAEPEQEVKADHWRRHNGLERVRPMVLIFPEGSWREMLPDTQLTGTSEFARRLERDFRVRLYYAEHLPDDNVIEAVVGTPIINWDTGWGLQGETKRPAAATGAYHIEPVIRSEADVDRLVLPQLRVDWDETARIEAVMHELFDGILAVERRGAGNYGIAPLDHYATLRGIDNLFMDLLDHPEMVHRAVRRIVDGHIGMAKAFEEMGVFRLCNRNQYVGSGGTSYSTELPGPDYDGKRVRPMDLWGFATAQIFSEVSPEMHEEFALQHEKRFLELFGLNCYGCCEPLHLKLDAIFRHVPRLRRVSISPWANVAMSAEKLGNRCIFSWKPNPAIVAGEVWDPGRVRAILTEFCEQTRDCVVEMILKDTHTCRNHPERMWDWVRIAREVAEQF
ncbi:MAG: hypothetical protein A2498_05765 [Lentisphaerae bacterium RIFOXYC12_FULL_60_16]|nr:MAG: hypothetical protein A2498_05765 [Lentisphaerae bacterium RIFOXYC12_FULL_60_16]OGV85412.1 MAG: hypothetical protein A2340_04775 [Lentisphaerae bacterium RIFOXYB12_FULL_60_10]